MYRLEKEFTFEASHKLPNHDGKCQRLHGHSWKMSVMVQGRQLVSSGPQKGMLVDYSRLSQIVKPFVDEFLDHHHLNDTTKLENPTSEELARWIYDGLAPKIYGWEGISFIGIRVNETCTSSCIYMP